MGNEVTMGMELRLRCLTVEDAGTFALHRLTRREERFSEPRDDDEYQLDLLLDGKMTKAKSWTGGIPLTEIPERIALLFVRGDRVPMTWDPKVERVVPAAVVARRGEL